MVIYENFHVWTSLQGEVDLNTIHSLALWVNPLVGEIQLQRRKFCAKCCCCDLCWFSGADLRRLLCPIWCVLHLIHVLHLSNMRTGSEWQFVHPLCELLQFRPLSSWYMHLRENWIIRGDILTEVDYVFHWICWGCLVTQFATVCFAGKHSRPLKT